MKIGVAATFYDEVNALPGWLESASRFFDHILLVECRPGGASTKPSRDGSLDIIRKWGLPDPEVWDLNEGFGAIRNRLMQTGPEAWTVILDIDERMQKYAEIITCEGDDRYPANPDPKLTVGRTGHIYNHRAVLEAHCAKAEADGLKAVRMRRRHWFDFSYARPCENFSAIPDYQMRCMKSRSAVGYTTEPKMHERAWDREEGRDPRYVPDHPDFGPVIDHFHCWFKRQEPEQRAADIVAYDSLHLSQTHTPVAQ